MAISTVFDFWTNEVSIYQTAVTAAQVALQSKQTTLVAAQTNNAKALMDQAATQAQIDALKRKLATDISPADADADAKSLRVLIAIARRQSGLVLSAREALSAAQSDFDAQTQQLPVLTSKLAEGTAGLAKATANKGLLDKWNAALLVTPLSTLKTDSAAAVAASASGTPRGDALARINHDFPSTLKDVAGTRRSVQNTRFGDLTQVVADTEALLVTHLQGHTNTSDIVEAARVNYDNAWNALADYVRTAKEQFDRALSLYASVSLAPPLTADEVADMTGGPARAAGEAALTPAENDRDTALQVVYVDAYKAEKAVVAAQAPDPTKSLGTLPEQTQLLTDQGTLDAKETTFSGGASHPTPKESLDAWEASLPDSAYHALLSFQEADEILTHLSGVTPATLQSNLTSSETALATALVDATQAARTSDYLRSILTQQSLRLEHARAVRQDRLFSYVRGDI